MSDKQKKYFYYALGFTGLTTLGYLLYKLLFKKKSIVEKDSNEEKNIKLNRLQSEIKEKDIKNKNETKEQTDIIDIYIFSEILKKIVNHSFEQLFIFSDLLRQNYGKDGKFIGTELGFDRNINEVQAEMIQKLQLENTRIIMSFGVSPTSYNNTLSHYLSKNQ